MLLAENCVASLAGFEPATRCLEGSRSIQLSYRDAPRGCAIKCSQCIYVRSSNAKKGAGISCTWSGRAARAFA